MVKRSLQFPKIIYEDPGPRDEVTNELEVIDNSLGIDTPQLNENQIKEQSLGIDGGSQAEMHNPNIERREL